MTVVSFDLDATLLDNGFIPATITACCEHLAKLLAVDAAAVAAANAAVWSDLWPHVEASLALGRTTGAELRAEVWQRVIDVLGHDDAEGAVLASVTEHHTSIDRAAARLYDDVVPVLSTLREAGVRLAVVTNGASDLQRSRLEDLDLVRHLDAIVISGEVGVVKPDVAIFEHLLRQLGVGAEDVWHVGDNLDTDVAGAAGAGLTPVWLDRLGTETAVRDTATDGVRVLRSLEGLPRLLLGT
jgi:putative hydrolase of the HAD superfamily